MNRMNNKGSSGISIAASLIALLLGASACEPETVVGEGAEDQFEADYEGPSFEILEIPEDPVCPRGPTQYEEWAGLANELGDFAGSVWEGYIDGGSNLTLFLGKNGNVELVVGEAMDTTNVDPSSGYFCRQDESSYCHDSNWLHEGATIPVRGIQSTERRLQIPVQVHPAFAPWCAQQTPHPHPSDIDGCEYGPLPDRWSGDVPQCGDPGVDCGFVNATKACRCNSVQCYPSLDIEYDFDLTLETDGSLEGSITHYGESNRRVQFWRTR